MIKFLRRHFFLASVFGVLALLTLYGVGQLLFGMFAGVAMRNAMGGPVPVVVASVTSREFAETLESVGTAKANESVELTAKTAETIARLDYSDGEVVAAGQTIATLTSREQSANLAAQRALLD